MRPTSVAISGIGAITAAGLGVDSLWHSVISGVSHIRKIRTFDSSQYTTQIAAEVPEFRVDKYIAPKLIKRTGRATQLAIIAVQEALADSKLDLSTTDLTRIAVIVGVSSPQLDVGEQSFSYIFEGGITRLPPTSLGAFFPNATAGFLTSLLNIQGPSLTISTGCSAGSNAVGQAMTMIQNDIVDKAIVVGTDSPITPFGVASFCVLKNMSTCNDSPTQACKPFDLERDGFVLGEGAGAMILEKAARHHTLKGPAYGYLTAYACTSSPEDSLNTNIEKNGLARAIRLALKSANLAPGSIAAINAHACGSKVFDRYEAVNILEVFGATSDAPRVFSIKPIIGHPLAAAGTLQVIVSALAFKNKLIPPVINYRSGESGLPLKIVTDLTETIKESDNVLIDDCGYGGNNVSLIMRGSSQAV